MLARFTHAVRQFLVDDDAGSVSVETVIIMPILLWVYVATFVIFDGFRTHNQNVKAA
jgi:Flp pilus assembly protein TadG